MSILVENLISSFLEVTWRLLGDYLVGGALGVNKIQIEKKGRGSLCRGLVLDGEGLGVLAQVWAGKSV